MNVLLIILRIALKIVQILKDLISAAVIVDIVWTLTFVCAKVHDLIVYCIN